MDGTVRTRLNRRTMIEEPVIKDEPPKPIEIETCRPRLYEEIYLVDPTIIVALGSQAAASLMKKSVSIAAVCGKPQLIQVPGAGVHASITDKKKAWVRRVKGVLHTPVEQNAVEYLMIPAFHPAYVLSRQAEDPRKTNTTLQMFLAALKTAVRIHNKLRLEIYGDTADLRDINEADILGGT